MSEEKKLTDSNKCLKAKKISFYWLLVTIYATFIGFELNHVRVISDFNLKLVEILLPLIALACFLIPIEFTVYIYYVFKCKVFEKENTKNKKILKAILVIMSLIVIVTILGYQLNESSTSGIFQAKNKVKEGNYYYIILDDKKIRCTQNEYNLININQDYAVTFIWNDFSNEGKLIQIRRFK